ncbi:hypothetical protein ABNY88_09275 [Escherichia coli]
MTHAPGYGVPGEAGQPFLVAFVEPFVAGLIAMRMFLRMLLNQPVWS